MGMTRLKTLLVALFVLAGPALSTAQADDTLQPQLQQLLERYLASARLANLAGAMTLVDAATLERWNRDRAAAQVELGRAAFDSFSTEAFVMEPSGEEASAYGVARRLGTPIELAAYFKRQPDGWRVSGIEAFANPDSAEKAADRGPEPITAWDPEKLISLHGRIVETGLIGDAAFAVLRVTVDQAGSPSQAYDTVLYLPKPADLAGIGVPLESLTPWSWLTVEGARHRTKPLKLLVTRLQR